MAISFPSGQSAGAKSVQNGREYTFDGYAWNLSSNVAGHASTHGAGAADAVTIQASQVSDFASVARSSVGAYGKTLLFG